MNVKDAGWYWVKTKGDYKTEWSEPYVEWIEQDVIDYYNEKGWNVDRVQVIQKVEIDGREE